MSQGLIAQVFVLAAVILIFVHRWTATKWLAAYVARHGRSPDRNWMTTSDADPLVERWRRRRLLALLPAVATFVIAMYLLLTAP